MAGLYWFFRENENDSVLYPAFTILTTEANNKVRNIHNRMPVIIDDENIEKWLFSDTPDEVIPLLRPVDDEQIEITEAV